MERRSENPGTRSRKARQSREKQGIRIHPELVGMLYSTLDSGRQYAWLKLRIPGRGNPQHFREV